MIRMTPLPVGQDDHARPKLAKHTHNLQTVLIGVLDAAVGNIQGFAATTLSDDGCGCGCFPCPVLRRSTRAAFASG